MINIPDAVGTFSYIPYLLLGDLLGRNRVYQVSSRKVYPSDPLTLIKITPFLDPSFFLSPVGEREKNILYVDTNCLYLQKAQSRL